MKSILIFAMLFSSVSAMANEMSSAQDDCNITISLFDKPKSLSGVDADLPNVLYSKGFMPFQIPELDKEAVLKNSSMYVSQGARGDGSWYFGYYCAVTVSIHKILPTGVIVKLWEGKVFDESSLNDNTTQACRRAFSRVLPTIPTCEDLKQRPAQ